MHRKKFKKEYIETELKKLGEKIGKRIKIYLIGGCSMIYRDAKTATKDIDAVVMHSSDIMSLVKALKSLGYHEVKELPGDYQKLGASVVLRNNDDFQCDIFYRQVCNNLIVTNGMIKRAEFLGSFGKIDIYLISSEDVFLFKSITERESDLDDMRMLIEKGLNWSVVSNECKSQDKKKIWETFLLSKLEELKNRFGIVTPIYKDIKKTAEDEMIKDMFLSIVKDGKTLKEIVGYVKKNLKYSESWTRKELEKLVKEDIIIVEDKTFRPIILSSTASK